jgi:hypothetical protein
MPPTVRIYILTRVFDRVFDIKFSDSSHMHMRAWTFADDYLNMWCNQSLLDCVAAVRTAAVVVEAGGSEEAVFRTFEGNNCNATDVADEITSIIEAAVYAERILHRVP